MFKRLRERITEETSKSIAQLGNSPKSTTESESKPTPVNSSEDLITLSENSAVVVPHTSSQQFSIGEDDDGSMSEQSTPQRNVDVSNGSVSTSSKKDPFSGGDASFSQEYRPKRLSYVPQSDIESEREEPPTLNLEGISKEQLLSVIDVLKARTYKYKNKYSEVVKNFKELKDEKTKIEKTLIDTQDKGSRRIAELREQCQLEQKAKAHLEANLRLMLEEKDNRISVLETQNNFLKDKSKSDSSSVLQDSDQLLGKSNEDLLTGDLVVLPSQENSVLQERLERLDHQLNQAKKAITSQTEQISLLRKQNENLSDELETKIKNINELEDQRVVIKSEHEIILNSMQVRLEELEKQQEESVMSMAETKKNMHEELELKEKQLVKAKKEASHFQSTVESEKQKVFELQKQYEEKLSELQRQLEATEKTLEDEKQNLMQELARGKTAAITLMQNDCAKKISAVEEEWKAKFLEVQSANSQTEEEKANISEIEDKLKLSETQVQELNSLAMQLEKENEALKNTAEKLKSGNVKVQNEENLKCLKEKYENAEKNYATQLEEMKERIVLLEKHKQIAEEDNLNLKKNILELTEKNSELKLERDKISKEYKEISQLTRQKISDKENEFKKIEAELESLAKESSEKVETLKKKIKTLEQEREQLMHEAQERVSTTEAKCREDVKLLLEEKNKLFSENKEIDQLRTKVNILEQKLQENQINLESSKTESAEKLSLLKEQLAESERKLHKIETDKRGTITELSEQLQKFKEENSLLVNKATHLESLKSEKETLNEKLKHTEMQISSYKKLETERDSLKLENSSLSEQLQKFQSLQCDNDLVKSNNESLVETVREFEVAKQELASENEQLRTNLNSLKESLGSEINSLKTRNEFLSQQIDLLEKLDPKDPTSLSVKNYIASVRLECENAVKAKDEDMHSKLKLLVHDFAGQMDLKDRDCDKITSEIIERNQELEERLETEYKNQISELRQSLFERECAYDDLREDYEERLQEKEKKIKEYESALKSLPSPGSGASPDSAILTADSSDWDETWAVPEENQKTHKNIKTLDNVTSPDHSNLNCDEHINEVENLKEELSKCHSEIKELKVLLRLSPPDLMMNNNTRRDSLQSIPEPTEFEYLKNIIYEYMMGKEPITLVKVIAAVLRFNETQTQQVIRKEESRHQMK